MAIPSDSLQLRARDYGSRNRSGDRSQDATPIPRPRWDAQVVDARHADGERLKRLVDVLSAGVLLVLLSPVMLLLAVLIPVTSRGGVLFRQTRIGRYGEPFTMLKFRTMRQDAAAEERQLAAQSGGVFLKIKNDARITWIGRPLRKYSLDELPQLLNVLRGDMSLVGPRPLLPSDLAQLPRGVCGRRFLVPPGLTGLWQVRGRSDCSDAQRVMLDLEYVERRGFWTDLLILLQTPRVVIAAEGAY